MRARIVDCWLKPSHVELPLYYPMTDESHFDDPPYREALARFYKESTVAIAPHLEAGRDVALLERGRPDALRLVHASVRSFARQFRCQHRAGRVEHLRRMGLRRARPMTWGDDALVVLPATLAARRA